MEWESQIKNTSFLVTGSAGFIGFHVARELLARGGRVVGNGLRVGRGLDSIDGAERLSLASPTFLATFGGF